MCSRAIEHYLSSLQAALREIGVGAELRVTKSNGGAMTAEAAKTRCIEMILSGTASGVIGASHIARLCGLERCLSLDIGGTSADVALIVDGEPQFGVGEFIGEFQVFVPSISVSSIGDGGGSVAWVDNTACSRSAPTAPDSSPGPACYGRGGVEPTITDAFAVNGWIGDSALGYDAVKLDRDAAIRSVSELAERVGATAHETAASIIDIAVSSMYSGVSAVVARYGIDPRRFSLLAFGGAGPMMANFLAREIGIEHIVIPATPGVLSAFGGLIADLKNDFVRTVYCDLSEATIAQHRLFRGPAARPRRILAARGAGLRRRGMRSACSAEMRYRGQSFELETALEESWLARRDSNAVAEAFHAKHQRVYGHCDAGRRDPGCRPAGRSFGSNAEAAIASARAGRGASRDRTAGRGLGWTARGARHRFLRRAALAAGPRYPRPGHHRPTRLHDLHSRLATRRRSTITAICISGGSIDEDDPRREPTCKFSPIMPPRRRRRWPTP